MKMVINILATTALSLVTYHWLVRFTAVGELLSGRRQVLTRQNRKVMPAS